jgi:hypothetical protein
VTRPEEEPDVAHWWLIADALPPPLEKFFYVDAVRTEPDDPGPPPEQVRGETVDQRAPRSGARLGLVSTDRTDATHAFPLWEGVVRSTV